MGQSDGVGNKIGEFIQSCLRMGYSHIHASDIAGFIKDNGIDMNLKVAKDVLDQMGCEV